MTLRAERQSARMSKIRRMLYNCTSMATMGCQRAKYLTHLDQVHSPFMPSVTNVGNVTLSAEKLQTVCTRTAHCGINRKAQNSMICQPRNSAKDRICCYRIWWNLQVNRVKERHKNSQTNLPQSRQQYSHIITGALAMDVYRKWEFSRAWCTIINPSLSMHDRRTMQFNKYLSSAKRWTLLFRNCNSQCRKKPNTTMS